MSKRLRRDQRDPIAPSMHLTERDKAIIQAVAEYRILRQDQLQTLFFGSKSTAQYRLSHLYQHGYLNRWFLPIVTGHGPTLYVLDRRGADLLRSEYGSEPRPMRHGITQPEYEFLAHTLAINDVRIAITLACQRQGFTLATWADETTMKATAERVEIRLPTGNHATVALIPDSYFVINTPSGVAHFFLELDRGTMTVNRFQTKIYAYMAYVASGAYQRRYQTRSLRVLTVTLAQQRRINLKRCTEAAQGNQHFWFGVLSELTSDTILKAPIWEVARLRSLHALITRTEPD